jgi:diguanylate cyclase (GGDEF)-like protein
MASAIAHLLLIDDEIDLLAPLARLLQIDGYRVSTAPSGLEGLKIAKHEGADLIILDVNMPEMDGYEVCRRLRADHKLQDIPILFLSGRGEAAAKIEGLEIGGDDYIVKPFDFAELKARIVSLLRRHRRGKGANPVTGVPAPGVVEEAVTRRIIAKRPFALAVVDIDDFRSYNDAYGYQKGDEVLRVLAKILQEALDREGAPDDLLAHGGGDDFMVLSDPERIHRIVAHLMEVFDWIAPSFYKEDDRERGGVLIKDRRGKEDLHPILRLSIGAATTEKRILSRYPQALQAAQEVCLYVGTLKRNASFFAVDRRTE